MQESVPKLRRWFLLAGIFAAVHTALAIFLVVAIFRGSNLETVMAFTLFGWVDYPIMPLCQTQTSIGLVSMLIFGGLLWFGYGFALQFLISKLRKRLLLAGILAAVHTAFVTFVVVAVVRSTDPEAIMAFVVFGWVDYPIMPLCQTQDLIGSVVGVFIFGGLLWFCYGFVLQSLISIRRLADFRQLGIGAVVLLFLWSIPEIKLRSQPSWKQQWDRASALDQDPNKFDSDEAIHYVSEAIRLSPKDNDMLGGMWDYLGNLYDHRKDYGRAEDAFKTSLAFVEAEKPSPKAQDMLNAYNELAQFYDRTGNKEQRKECLQKAIEFNRIVYGGDSVQEAGCWESLANIAHDSGDPKDAQDMLERAIKMEFNLHDPDTWSLNYMKDELKKWTTK